MNYIANENAVAVIAMACRFPMGNSPEEFWENLRSGKEAICTLDPTALAPSAIADSKLPGYVSRASMITGIEEFDADFFSMTPREAEILDPQFRVLLECSYHALEKAGYADCTQPRDIGVYVGTGASHYAGRNLLSHPEIIESMGYMALSIANERDFSATQIAYRLNLRGPAVSINTACSTSLVAIHQAVSALLNFECDAALAGGATVKPQQNEGYQYLNGGILSPDGRCRAFSNDAMGTVPGNGGGIVLLKRLEDAIADNDDISAVIVGSAINNDGANKMGITAPSVIGQARVIREAIHVADLKNNCMDYIEAHGTGTLLGDPIEIQALNEAYNLTFDKDHRCAIGSVKSNMGHLDTAAGIAGFIKAVLAVKHAQIPPSINFSEENKNIDFGNFYVADQLNEWPTNQRPRFAAVSSFGIGGTNAHIILCQSPVATTAIAAKQKVDPYLICLSAKSEKSLRLYAESFAKYASDSPEFLMAEISLGLLASRPKYQYRMSVANVEKGQLADALSRAVISHHEDDGSIKTVWLFPGQGAQYINMAKALYEHCNEFAQAFDECNQYIKNFCEKNADYFGFPDLSCLLFPCSEENSQQSKLLLDNTKYTQIAVFVIDYCTAQLLLSAGCKPDALLGHSLGEYAAACIAGIFSLKDAIELVMVRGHLISRLPEGGMISVAAGEERLQYVNTKELALAAKNSRNLLVYSGTLDAISTFAGDLQNNNLSGTVIPVSHAFHSPMMEDAIPLLREVLKSISLGKPKINIVSNLTGELLSDQQATDPQYWLDHLLHTVKFSDGIAFLEHRFSKPVYLEVGPGLGLSTLAKRNGVDDFRVINTLPHAKSQEEAHLSLLNSLGALWSRGADIKLKKFLSGFYGISHIRNLSLPPYVFDKKVCWIDCSDFDFNALSTNQSAIGRTSINHPDDQYFLYHIAWREMAWPRLPDTTRDENTRAVYISDDPYFRESTKDHSIFISRANEFNEHGPTHFSLRPTVVGDWKLLLERIKLAGLKIRCIDYLLLLEGIQQRKEIGTEDLCQHYLTLAALAKALSQEWDDMLQPCCLRICTTAAFQVSGRDLLDPTARALTAAVRVLAQEEPVINSYILDLDPHFPDSVKYNLIKITPPQYEDKPVVAIRGNHFYYESLSDNPVPLEQHRFEPDQLSLNVNDIFECTLVENNLCNIAVFVGGLGKAGAGICGELATRYQRVIVVGRRGVEQLPVDKVELLSALTQAYNNIEYFPADISNERSLKNLFESILENGGVINLLLHGAGAMDIPDLIAFADTEEENCRKQLTAKVDGTRLLYEIACQYKVENILLMSSLSAWIGGLGMSAYALANGYMDGFAEALAVNFPDSANVKPRCFSIAFDGLETLQNIIQPEFINRKEHRIVSAHTVVCAIEKTLGLIAIEHRLLSSGGLIKKYEHSLNPQRSTSKALVIDTQLPAREILPLDGDLEIQVANIFSMLLGITTISANDSFFELGGDSLLATQLVSRLNAVFQIDLTIATVFEHTRVRDIAEQIVLRMDDSSGESITSLIEMIDTLDDDEVNRLLAESLIDSV